MPLSAEYSAVWENFGMIERQTKVNTLVDSMLAHGPIGLDLLQRVATLSSVTYNRGQLGRLWLPWYRSSSFGPGAWWSISEPYTVAQWGLYGRQGLQTVKTFLRAKESLSRLGPILTVCDSKLDVTIIADGCHRAIAHYILRRPLQAIRLESPVAAILYGPDFLHHAIRKNGKGHA